MVPRLILLIVAIVGTYSALLFRLYNLQVQNGAQYVAQAESQMTGILPAPRGLIYFTDRNGIPLPVASNKMFPRIFAVPREIEDPAEAAHRVAAALDRPPEEFVSSFEKQNSSYELIQEKATAPEVSAVQDLSIKGVYIQQFPERFYPFGTLAAQLLGYVGPSETGVTEVGHYGMEEMYEDRLAGRAGELRDGNVVPQEMGEDVHLTIDPNIQIQAERILDKLVQDYQATGGSVLVMEPKTGKILTVGSAPNFDPNDYAASPIKNFLNPVFQSLYEPGSVFKVLTMAAGIDAGKITPETTYQDTGSVTVSGRKIQNWDLEAHGLMTMTNVIEKSLNTGAVFAEQKTGHTTFTQYLHAFGLGDPTGADVPEERAGDLRQLHDGAPAVAFATAAFGQGVAVTPLELLDAIAAIANGGVLMRPYIDLNEKPQVIRRVIAPETAKKVTDMMVSAVDKAEVAAIKGFGVAGKTGTAYIPDFVHGGYTDHVINTYVGFAPATDPRFIILIKLNDPANAPLAGVTVVPAFRDLAQYIINYYDIPPDRL